MRTTHYPQLAESAPPVDWLEAISENFLLRGGRPLWMLDKVRRDVPVVLHGVSLSIGATDPLNRDYLRELRALCERVEPAWVSDHLCWGTHGGRYAHELLPLPYTEESLAHVVERVLAVQDALGRQILLENVSSYVGFRQSTMPEWEFLAEVARRADCGILLDVNNVYVSARNHGFDPLAYLDGIPGDRVGQLHLAGHTNKGTHLLDTHDHPVPEGVWDLYREVLRRYGRISTLVEWDDNIPPLAELCAQSRRAAEIEREVLGPKAEEAPRPAAAEVVSRAPRRAAAPGELASTLDLFYDVVRRGEEPPAELIGEIERVFTPSPELTAVQRVHIYTEMILWRMVDALREDFPAVAAILGDHGFYHMAERYLAAHPSEHPSLARLGRHLAAFLRAHADERFDEDVPPRPDLGDLAALEWAECEVFEEVMVEPAPATALQGLDPAAFMEATLRFVPGLRLLDLEHDVVPVWDAAVDDEQETVPPPRPVPTSVAVWRRGFDPVHATLNPDEARALRWALEGRPLGEVCGAFAGRVLAAQAAFEALASWLTEGWVAEVVLAGAQPGEPAPAPRAKRAARPAKAPRATKTARPARAPRATKTAPSAKAARRRAG